MSRHLAAPLRLSPAGSLVTLTQDSPAEVGQSVGLLVATRIGERRSEPSYGTPDPLYVGADASALAAAVAAWEPRAEPASVEVTVGPDGQTVTLTPGAAADVI